MVERQREGERAERPDSTRPRAAEEAFCVFGGQMSAATSRCKGDQEGGQSKCARRPDGGSQESSLMAGDEAERLEFPPAFA
jgi:hypothetical protein